jgi:transposase
LCLSIDVEDSNAKTLNDLKKDFEGLRHQLSTEAQLLFSMMFRLIEVLINSLSKKRATSSNSHLPPSQDPNRLKKEKNGNGRKPGGQNGHKGSSLAMSPNPDKIIQHPAVKCDDCGVNLKKITVDNVTCHQIIDIKFTKIIVEHQVEHKTCKCGHHQCYPVAEALVQYGRGLKATAVELNQVQCIPYKFRRCTKLQSDSIIYFNYAKKRD